jgi:uroporphyrinogen-III synthase
MLPVHAVGAATARAAEAAGFRVLTVGSGDLGNLLAELQVSLRLLHLAGEDRSEAPADRRFDSLIVYRSVPVDAPCLPDLDGMVAAVHSPRAGRRLAELATARHRTDIAAISAAAANACGDGWERVEMAERPNDSSLLALAAMLCHTSPRA